MSEPKLPEPAAWREDDGRWIYYDETNSPSTFAHIRDHQKDAHEVSVFALYTADQVRQIREMDREGLALMCESMMDPEDDGWDSCLREVAAAIRGAKP